MPTLSFTCVTPPSLYLAPFKHAHTLSCICNPTLSCMATLLPLPGAFKHAHTLSYLCNRIGSSSRTQPAGQQNKAARSDTQRAHSDTQHAVTLSRTQ